MHHPPSRDALAEAIANAARSAITEMFSSHPADHFYYCSLITTGGGLAPTLTAWSMEALAAAAQGDRESEAELKWAWADSPFCGFGDHHFQRVVELFGARPAPAVDDYAGWDQEFELRIGAMEQAMLQLDSEGIFGRGAARDAIVINAEVMPPDYGNVERAIRLNPPAALTNWLREAAEHP